MVFDLPPPAIIQRAEPWELNLYHKLSSLGLPHYVKRAIVAEAKRLEGSQARILKPALADLARYGKDPALAHLLVPPIGWSVAAPVTTNFLSSNVHGSSATSNSWPGLTLSATNPVVVCCTFRNSNGTIDTSNFVIGNDTACTVLQQQQAAGGADFSAIVIGTPGTATGTITLAITGTSASQMSYFAYELIGNVGEAAANTYASNTALVSNTQAEVSINCAANGCAIGVCFHDANNGTQAWTGLTERAEHSHSGRPGSSASANFATTQTGLTVNVTTTGGSATDISLCVATFEP